MLKTPPSFAIIGERKFKIAALLVFLVIIVLGIRLWYVQIYRGAYYSRIAEHNRMRKLAIPAPRGLVFDRHGRLLLGNRPSFNLLYVPQDAQQREHTLRLLADLVHVPATTLGQRIDLARVVLNFAHRAQTCFVTTRGVVVEYQSHVSAWH